MKTFEVAAKVSKRERIFISLIFTLFLVVIHHGLFLEYGFTDDYEFLLNASNDNFINVFVQGGRFICGYFIKTAFSLLEGVQQLWVLRLIGLMGAVILVSIVYDYLRKTNYTNKHAFFICLLVVCSPSLSIKIGWSLAFIFPFILSLSFLYGVYLTKLSAWKAILLCPIGLIVLFTYQPIYTFSLIPLVLLWMKEKVPLNLLVKVLIIHLSTYFIYYLLFKYSLNVFELTPLSRSSVDLDFINKIKWFVEEPFKKALKYNFIFTDKALAWIIISIVSIGLLFHIYLRKEKKIVLNSLILCAFIFLSYLPNLVASDPWVSYRTMDSMVLIIILVASSNLFYASFKYQYYLIWSVAIIISVSAYYNLNYGLSYIQTNEYNLLKKELIKTHEGDDIIFIQPGIKFLSENGFLNKTVTDEFGRMSTSSDWVPEPMIKLIYNDLGKSYPRVSVMNKIPDNTEGKSIINMESLYLKYKAE